MDAKNKKDRIKMDNFNRKIGLSFAIIPLSIVGAISSASANPNQSVSVTLVAPPPFLLAKRYDPGIELSRYLISEKLDGVRAYWNGKNLVTRGGYIINAPSWFTKKFPIADLDGELWLGRKQFERLSGIVRKKQPVESEWHLVKFVVFDLPKDLSSFEIRYQKLLDLKEQSTSRYLTVTKQVTVTSKTELDDQLARITAKGGEGLMLHRKDSIYQVKRSFDLQKMKPFDDDEAVVIAHIEGKGKYKNMLGAIEVINKEGVQFKIGSGFSLKERLNPPPLNSEITYRYRGKTNKNTPRFATFLRMKIIE